MKIVTVEEMRRIEERCVQQGVSLDTLMENAGLTVARKARERLDVVRQAPLLVLVGPGNNGGDGLVAARHLREWGTGVTTYLVSPRAENDPKLTLLHDAGAPAVSAEDDPSFETLDGLLGHGTPGNRRAARNRPVATNRGYDGRGIVASGKGEE